jgi:hypothetical protein
MSATPKKAPPLVFGSDAAPIVFFDGATAFGVAAGVVSVELAAGCLVPAASGDGVGSRTLITAHLRASIPAMLQLRESIEKALGVLEKPTAKKE